MPHPNPARDEIPEGIKPETKFKSESFSEEKSELHLFDDMAEHLYAAALADILDELGYRNQVVSPELMLLPLHPGMVAVGRALTMLNDTDTNTEDPYALAIEALDNMKPGEVVVGSCRKPMLPGNFGELSATRVINAGGRGAIINGYTRDGRKLLEMNFPMFCRGMSPIDTKGRSRIVDCNCEIQLGDHTVKPGQIIFADYDGIVVIPHEVEDEVVSKALQKVKVENLVREELKQGVSMDEVWNKYHVL